MMSTATLPPSAGDFDGFDDFDVEFAAIVADFDLDTDSRVPPRRPARTTERRQAIHESLGIRRHRSSEREI
jgi:hypothetical protein